MPRERKLDEEFARQLLTERLIEQGESGFECKVNSNDPPDLVVIWSNGIQWGVEVTRTYQQVAGSSATSAISSVGITEPLYRFGEKLGEATKSMRKRDYYLHLGPSPVDSLQGQSIVFDKDWKKKTEKAIRQHIVADRMDILRCAGVRFTPSNSGNPWKVTASSGVAEINTATLLDMLKRAMNEKVKALPRWNGNFVKRWLLLLNGYPLVNDVREVEKVLKQLILSNRCLLGFDGVFWSGCSDRALVPIPVRRC